MFGCCDFSVVYYVLFVQLQFEESQDYYLYSGCIGYYDIENGQFVDYDCGNCLDREDIQVFVGIGQNECIGECCQYIEQVELFVVEVEFCFQIIGGQGNEICLIKVREYGQQVICGQLVGIVLEE